MSRAIPPALPSLRQLLGRVHLRLTFFAAILSGLLLMTTGIIVINGYAERNLSLAARTIAYTIEPAVVFGDTEAMREGMLSVGVINDLDEISVHGADGRLLVRWERTTTNAFDRVELWISRAVWREPTIETIRRGRTTLAEVRVHGNVGSIITYLFTGVVIAIACLVLSIFVTHLLAIRLQNGVTAHLTEVADVAHAVRTERAFDRRLSSSGIAEIERFSQDFNALLAELEGWHNHLTTENQALTLQATHDDLTALGNRALFQQYLDRAIIEASRSSVSCAVLYLDANRFKDVNDRFGHAAGDAVLQVIAGRLSQCIRESDKAFRLGGDEFAIILAPVSGRDDVHLIISRVHQIMESPVILPDGAQLLVSLSAGFAVHPQDGEGMGDLLCHADAAMYLDKRRRDRFAV